MKKIDRTGIRYGRLTVIRQSEQSRVGKIKWDCKCDCGNVTAVTSSDLKTGNTQSCGCFGATRALTHGLSKHPLYIVHKGMIQRCHNENATNYKDYGARGISVCKEWLDFQAFYDWAIANGWKKRLQIDRINNNGNYEPSNCRIITQKENLMNSSRVKMNEWKARVMRVMHKNHGWSCRRIGQFFGVDNSYTSKIIRGIYWAQTT